MLLLLIDINISRLTMIIFQLFILRNSLLACWMVQMEYLLFTLRISLVIHDSLAVRDVIVTVR